MLLKMIMIIDMIMVLVSRMRSQLMLIIVMTIKYDDGSHDGDDVQNGDVVTDGAEDADDHDGGR